MRRNDQRPKAITRLWLWLWCSAGVVSRRLVIWVCLSFFSMSGFAQTDWTVRAIANLGVSINYYYSTSHQFPGLKAFVGVGVSGTYQNVFLANYGTSLSFYTKSLGSHLSPMVNDAQLDWQNAFTVGGVSVSNGRFKYLRTLGNSQAYTLGIDNDYGVFVTTNAILNNHRRNQWIGAVTGITPHVSVNYYNDGAPPFNFLAVADGFDRWWTGGIAVFVHNRNAYNDVEFSFDQFTGFRPLQYELSGILGLSLPSYNRSFYDDQPTSRAHKRPPPNFNTSAYNLRITPFQHFSANVGVIGAMRGNNGKSYALQDIIHILGRFPLHPNHDFNRFYLGTTFFSTDARSF